MSKSKKKKNSSKKYTEKSSVAGKTSTPTVNTLGIDIEPAEQPVVTADDFSPESETEVSDVLWKMPAEWVTDISQDDTDEADAPQYALLDKVIGYATLALSMLLLGGSLVFWWIISKHLIQNPANLVDSAQMKAVLVCSGIFPVIVAVVQSLLRRPINIERWLINMCISGALSTLAIIVYQLGIRGEELTFADLPTLICCTVSGATLPAALCTGARHIFPIIFGYFKRSITSANIEDWDEICADLSSFAGDDDQ